MVVNCRLPNRILDIIKTITAAISGTGDSTRCLVTYNETSYYTSGDTFSCQAGDTVRFTVYARNTTYLGWVKIDGTTVAQTSSSSQTLSYDWTVPSNISSISITLNYVSTSAQRHGEITVVTL